MVSTAWLQRVLCWSMWAGIVKRPTQINDTDFDVVAEAEAVLADANAALV